MGNRFIKFVAVGILNTIFGYSVFALLIFGGLHYSFAVFLSTIIGVLFNFKTIGSLVFRNSHPKLLFKFLVTYSVVYLANILLIKLGLLLNLTIYIAGALATVITAITSYLLNAKWVFREST